MTDTGWDGWCKMHARPIVRIRWFLLAETGSLLCSLYTLSALPFKHPIFLYAFTLPLAAGTICDATLSFLMWRFGPQIVSQPLSLVLFAGYVLASSPLVIIGYVLPESALSWNNMVHFLCVNGFGTFFALHAAAAGKLASEHPQQPRTSITKPVTHTIVRILHMVDCLTDMTVILTVIQAVCHSSSPLCLILGISHSCKWLLMFFQHSINCTMSI